jgi:hypothetical protein
MTYEEYLQHADECERLAGAALLPSNRNALLSAAEMWRRMAADAEPRDGVGTRSPLRPPRQLDFTVAADEPDARPRHATAREDLPMANAPDHKLR